ncbi:MAG: hypothetical protein LBE74_06975 [Treponema sp.]|nr:hypothetical protein [Treponema sp.]
MSDNDGVVSDTTRTGTGRVYRADGSAGVRHRWMERRWDGAIASTITAENRATSDDILRRLAESGGAGLQRRGVAQSSCEPTSVMESPVYCEVV